MADALAEAWELAPGAAKFWRSSACHVFAVAPAHAYLRIVPDPCRTRDELVAVSELMLRLSESLPVAVPVAGADGALVQSRETDLGTMHATLVRAAPGDEIDDDDVTAQTSHAWGAHLARLHGGVAAGLPARALLSHLPDDASLASAVATLRDRAAAAHAATGFVHGDFELDNLRWEGGVATCFDLDDAGQGDQVADIALATRAIRDRSDQLDAFLQGYHSVRPLSKAAVAALPAYDGIVAARTVASIDAALEVGGRPPQLADDDPLSALRTRLVQRRAVEHERVLRLAGSV